MKETSSKELFKQVFLVTGGQAVRAGLGFLAIVMTARLLSVEDFGLFSLFIATVAIGSQLTGQTLDLGLVRFASRHLKTAREKSLLYIKTVFKIRVVVSVIILLLAFGLVDFIADDIFKKPEYRTPLFFASFGAIAMSMWSFTLAVAQAKEKFTLHAILNSSNGIIKVTAVGFLLYLNLKTLDTVLFTYILSFIAMFIIGMALIPKSFLKKQETDKGTISELLHFSKWILASDIAFVIQTHSGIYFIGYFLDAAAVGKFASAWNLAYAIDLIVFALVTVLSPKVSKIHKKEDLTAYMKKSVMISVLFSALCIPIFIYAKPIVTFIYSENFSDVGLIFQIMLLGFLIGIPGQLIALVLLSLNQPKYFSYVAGADLVLTCIGYIIFIPQFSLMGAAMVLFVMKVFHGTLLMGICYFLVNRPESMAPVAKENL